MIFFKVVSLLGLMSPFALWAGVLGYPCSGAEGDFHINPDNSIGGFVESTAYVSSDVFVAPDASVCEYAKVSGKVVLSDRAEISGRADVSGLVSISGVSKISGYAILRNETENGLPLNVTNQAKIYGNAYLNGAITVSDSSEIYGYVKIVGDGSILGASRVCGSHIFRGRFVLNDSRTYCNRGNK